MTNFVNFTQMFSKGAICKILSLKYETQQSSILHVTPLKTFPNYVDQKCKYVGVMFPSKHVLLLRILTYKRRGSYETFSPSDVKFALSSDF